MEAVRQSVFTQKVTYRNNGDGTFGVIAGSKSSSTQVGCQMEIDDDYYSVATKTTKYNDYVRIFLNNAGQAGDPLPIKPSFYKNHYPFSFYCDAKYATHFQELCEQVADFQGNDPA